jgi:tRNA threonylcarbamoyladenosine biosynthesis protein TsaE
VSTLNFISHSPDQTKDLGNRIGQLVALGDILLLSGELGSGKTCLAQGVALGLGITDYVTSPSFVLIREYHGRLSMYHVDLYRLDNNEEIANLGLDDYFYDRGISIIEWAEKGLDVLPVEHLLIKISYLSDTARCLKLIPRGNRYQELISKLGLPREEECS